VAQVKVLGRGRRAPAVACSGSSAFADAAAHAVYVSQPPWFPHTLPSVVVHAGAKQILNLPSGFGLRLLAGQKAKW